jgi:tetratricopeptide (TPR) repeat protein
MAKVFLSYSRKDAAKAQRFTVWLERDGHDVWRDDDDIGGGASFSSEIEKALKDCDAVVVLWSAESVQSAWVRDEAGYGRDAGKLIPLSLDGTEPPLGFRQFQSIDVSKWRPHGQPPAAERIKSAIARVAGASEFTAVGVAPPPSRFRFVPKLTRAALVAGLLALAALAGLSFVLLQRTSANRGITIAVLPSPTSSDRATAADYANLAAADMASFLPTKFDGATVIAPADAADHKSGYRMLISTNRHANDAEASLTLSDSDGRAIIWSKTWSGADASSVDLPREVSRSASQAALCLTEAMGGAKHIDQPALGLYITGCVGFDDPNWSVDQALSTFDRVVKLAPEFPKGWERLAVARAIFAEVQQDRSGTADVAAVRSAHDAIAMARKLDPRSGLAYLAEWHLVYRDPLQGLAVLDKAVKIAPDEPLLHARRADSLESVGRMTDSVEEAGRAVELDPLSSFTRSQYILALAYAGNFSQAKNDLADALKKWPNNSDIIGVEYGFQYRYGDAKVADQLMSRVLDNTDADMEPNRKLIAARLDPTPAKIDDALDAFRARRTSQPGGGPKLILALGTLGKSVEAYELLNDPKFPPFNEPYLLFRPEFAPFRADPRFMRLAARLGLVRYWTTSGNWPDFCTSEQPHYDCKTEAAKYK